MQTSSAGHTAGSSQVTAYVEALKTYSKAGISFERDLVECLSFGYVFAGPDYLLMGFDVDGFGWFVRYAGGVNALGKFLDLMPYYLPHVGWERALRGRGIKWHKTEDIMRVIKRKEPYGK